MFELFAILSALGYSLNSIGSTYFARKLDPYSAGMYRNLSMGISFFPIVFFIPHEYLNISWEAFGWIALSSAIMIGTVFGENKILHFLPLGVYIGIQMVLKIIATTFVAVLFLKETWPSTSEVVWISVAAVGALLLAVQNKQHGHLKQASWPTKIILLLIIVLSISTGFPLLAKASEHVHPLVAAHIWEFMIGVWAFIILSVRHMTTQKKIQRISKKTFGRIILYCSPTILGTGGFTIASTLGDVSILTAIGVSILAMSSLLGAFFFHEKLNRIQIISIGIIILGIVGLSIWN